MDFTDSPQEAAFRAEARAWLDAHAPRRTGSTEQGGIAAMMSESGDDPAFVAASKAWQRTLFQGGWAALTWPKAYGGRDAGFADVYIWAQELTRSDVPPSVSTIGIMLIGPTIIAHGTPEQKDRYLEKMLSGDEVWCQLWSEPNAGSDLASLGTRAVRDDATGDWILNGQKVWTSGAHYSDFGLCITRSDPDLPKHRGISCFIVDMRSPGITVRGLRQMTGGANFNEVFFDDVRIPAQNLVGDVNDGWRVAMTTLMNERYGAASFDLGGIVDPVVALARKTVRDGRAAAEDPVIRQKLAACFIGAKLLTLTSYRSFTKMAKGSIPGPEGSTMKLAWSDLASEVAALGTNILGLASLEVGPSAPDDGQWALGYLFAPGIHLGGGTDAIQRNIIGERVLGLPREPQIDKDVPYKEIVRWMTQSSTK